MNLLCRWLLPLIAVLSTCGSAFATHLRAGEITATRVSCTGRTFLITITVYIDTESGVEFGGPGEILHFGDSTWIEVPMTTTTPRTDLGENMGMATFTVAHTYAGPGRFLLRYSEPFRNGDVVNINNPLSTLFYIETAIVIDPLIGCNNTPRLQAPPIDKACVGAAWFHNPSAFDIDGDSLSYELIPPKMGKGVNVENYRDPNTREFYDRGGINYNTADEAGLGTPTFFIDNEGKITWDAPGLQGEYNIAFYIKEWRKVNGQVTQIGFVERDMQILVEDCENQRPELIVPADICVEAGTKITQDIFGFDPDSDDVIIETFSQVLILNPSPAKVTPFPAVVQPSSPANPARIGFEWQTDCSHVRREPYSVTFKITDRPRSGGVRLTQFQTWNITVVGPAPEWTTSTIDPPSRSATVAWEPYPCNNATTIQLYRRVDSYAYTPPECVTGIPDFLGYTKIADLPVNATSFVDNNGGKGLAAGAKFCYRLLAIYPQPNGGESYVSQEICLEPIRADAPVITNVTVDKTGAQDGVITVKWRSPFDIDKAQFPPPYTYEVYRAEGITGTIRISKPHPGRLTDSTWVDTGLNTEQLMYNYRIVAYDAGNNKIDTSYTASSVRVATKSLVGRIELTWAADVPWSNETERYPRHLIFRGPAGSSESQLELIDSVDVNQNGFRYTDEGKYKGIALDNTQTYCYRVMTRGAYGNPNIREPLLNFSQRMCARPNDQDPPCVPVFAANLVGVSCDDPARNGCGANVFTNVLRWNRPEDPLCAADIASYSIYVSDQTGGTFQPYVENVRDTFFVDRNENLKSFARCYKIMAVDFSGNKSELSEEFCFDNCPQYALPNVFTPNGDGCNDTFTAFGDPDRSGRCDPDEDPSKCARFVGSVDFVVYDKWGKEIYTLGNGSERSIYIRWNGSDNQGFALPGGVYYYKAEVRFITVDPKKERQTIKGWVHLIRGEGE